MRAWLGLGSNMGDRLANLHAGCDALERNGVRIVARSHVYETEAMDGAVGQQDFYNACIAVETEQDPHELLATAKKIELELGRDPNAPRHSARPLDIDILLADEGGNKGPGHLLPTLPLTLPHPGITSRRFVLEPLLELDPPDREQLEAARARVADQRVTRIMPACF